MEKKKISPEQRYYDNLNKQDTAKLVIEAESLLRTIHNKKTEVNMIINILTRRNENIDRERFIEYVEFPSKFITNTVDEDLHYGLDNYDEQF